MSITVYANNEILVNGTKTGLAVSQKKEGTFVYVYKTGAEVKMPSVRYALSCDRPASGAAGRAQFEQDILSALNDQ